MWEMWCDCLIRESPSVAWHKEKHVLLTQRNGPDAVLIAGKHIHSISTFWRWGKQEEETAQIVKDKFCKTEEPSLKEMQRRHTWDAIREMREHMCSTDFNVDQDWMRWVSASGMHLSSSFSDTTQIPDSSVFFYASLLLPSYEFSLL
jgi:hypothetical protein